MNHTTRTQFVRYGLWGVGSLVVISVILSIITLRALPGNPLYALKVNVFEEGIEWFFVSPAALADYHLSLLDRRIAETQALAARPEGNQGDADYLFRESEERARELSALLAENPGTTFTPSDILSSTHELVVRLRTQEAVADRSQTIAAYSDSLGDARREFAQLYDARAAEFVAQTDSEGVKAQLGRDLNALLDALSDANLSSVTERRVQRAIQAAQTEIARGEVVEAFGQIGDARRAVAVEARIGPEVVKTEPAPTPQTDTGTTSTVTVPTAPAAGSGERAN